MTYVLSVISCCLSSNNGYVLCSRAHRYVYIDCLLYLCMMQKEAKS